jgi:hypothetical protein
MPRTRLLTAPSAIAASVVMTAAIAACGGGSPTPSNATTTSFSSIVAQAYKFSDCMRSNGMPNFPDPRVTNTAGQQSIGIAVVNSPSPAMQAARKACAKYAPSGGPANGPDGGKPKAQIQAEFALARCLRSNGFPKFPDPNSQGQLTPEQFAAAGINLSQPGFLTAASKCLPATHGVITVAMLRKAIAHDTGAQGGSGNGG